MDDMLANLSHQLSERSLHVPQINPDGEWHSFKWNQSDRGAKGSYRAIITPFGVEIFVKNWKDQTQNFSIQSFSRDLTPEEVEAHKQKVKEMNDQHERQTEMRQNTVALDAQKRWDLGTEDANHPYLIKKNLKSHYGTRTHLGQLMIPLRDINGKLWGIESVSSDGKKMGMKGMRKIGCYHFIPGKSLDDNTLYIVEGFSTGATLHEATSQSVAISFGASNMEHVAKAFKAKYPNINLIISGDADHEGIKKSKRIAREIPKAKALIPQFKSPHPDYTDWNDLNSLEGAHEVINQIQNFKTEVHEQSSEKQRWLSEYLESHNVTYHYSGLVMSDGQQTPLHVMTADMFLKAESEQMKIDSKLIEKFITRWISEEREKIWSDIKNSICQFKEDPSQNLETLVSLIARDPNPKLEIAVLKHFIWQVKRKASSMPVYHHICPVFVGDQGGGKTETIKKILAPVATLTKHMDLAELSDGRNFMMLNEYLIGNFDEMGKAANADIATLKHKISSTETSGRILYSQNQITLTNRCTFIGSSNEAVKRLVKDTSSTNRRFFEILIKDRVVMKDLWQFINPLDALAMWTAVDHRKDSPILECLEEIYEFQKSRKPETTVEIWAKELGLQSHETAFNETQSLYDLYTSWIQKNGYRIHEVENKNQFSESLESLFPGSRSRTKYARGFKLLYDGEAVLNY